MMQANQAFGLIMDLATLVYVMTRMLAMGFSLTTTQIVYPSDKSALVRKKWAQ
jgi:hypothetical protein